MTTTTSTSGSSAPAAYPDFTAMPIVMLDDADLDASVDAAVFGSFFHSGQICMISNRLIVDASVLDGFLTRFTARIQALRAGDPSDPETDIGPVINAKQLSSIQDRVHGGVHHYLTWALLDLTGR